jgi:type VI protein secretion system component Hcp
VLLGVGLAGGAAAVAVATVPDSSGVIHACYSVAAAGPNKVLPTQGGPNVWIYDPSEGQTCSDPAAGATSPQPISWNVTGPQGPPGRNGIQGPPGKPGTATFTYTLVPPQVKVTAPPDGGVVLGTGRSAISFQFLSFSFAVKGGAHGSGGGQSSPGTITITKAHDKVSQQLFKLTLTGKRFQQATITLVKKTGGKQPYLQITLDNAFITSFQTGSSKGDQRPEETLTLGYAKISEKYFK